MMLYILIGGMGLVSGFLSGLLGIGGGIIMTPLLLYLPPLFGFEPLPMRVVAGLTIVHGLVAGVSGTVSHYQFRSISTRLSLVMGSVIFVAALVGGAGASWVSNDILMFIFAVLALLASGLMLARPKQEEEYPDVVQLSFSRWRAIIAAGSVGFFGGLVGQGGSFILVPLMIHFVRIPSRIAIGSNLAIIVLSAAAGFIGKAITGQIEWLLAIPVVVAVIPAARLGSYLSNKTKVISLRRILALLIAVVACRMWWSLLFQA